MPIVLPSREKEWQLAQLWMPSISSLAVRLRHIAQAPGDQRHLLDASGLITPFSVSDGISGTSR